jgi:hypothetical protein
MLVLDKSLEIINGEDEFLEILEAFDNTLVV